MKRTFAAFALSLVLLGACGWISCLADSRAPKVYGGTQIDLRKLLGESSGVSNWVLVADLPLSFVFDTAFLPVMIVWEIFRPARPVRAPGTSNPEFPGGRDTIP